MSGLKKYSVRLKGHATSLTLEPPFWDQLGLLGQSQGRSRQSLIEEIDEARQGNLSSAIRLYVLAHLLKQNEEKGL